MPLVIGHALTSSSPTVIKEIKSTHKIVQSINGKKSIYCSPGHLIKLVDYDADQKEFINFLSS